MAGADILVATMPAYAQEKLARRLSEYIKPGQAVFLMPGTTGGALAFAKVLHDLGKLHGVTVCETATLPYGTRKTGPTSVNVGASITCLYFAALPAGHTAEYFEVFQQLYPAARMADSVLETSLNNGNIISHPAVMICNASNVEKKPDNYHYRDGVTPSVCRLLDQVDMERKKICDAFGYKWYNKAESLYMTGYATKLADSTYEAYQCCPSHLATAGPTSLDYRFLTEDGPYSMVPLASIADGLGVDTPLMDAVAHMGGALLGRDFWKEGRTAEKMGLAGKTVEEIKEFLQYGYRD